MDVVQLCEPLTLGHVPLHAHHVAHAHVSAVGMYKEAFRSLDLIVDVCVLFL